MSSDTESEAIINARPRLSRRQFIKALSAIAAGASLSPLLGWWGTPTSYAQDSVSYFPLIRNTNFNDVVHVHSPSATNWDYSSSTHYWNFVNQSTVDNMVAEGIKHLTGAHAETDAWASILPDYITGKRIAIKINLNNSYNELNNKIDALYAGDQQHDQIAQDLRSKRE